MNLQPLEDRIVVRPSDFESTTASGLVIPDTAKEKPQQGDVLAVGPGRRSEQTGELVPMDVAEGDTVDIVGPHGRAFARGLAAVDAEVARRVIGLRTGDLPDGVNHEVVHRDDLVVLPA